jgi:hypothetical protein
MAGITLDVVTAPVACAVPHDHFRIVTAASRNSCISLATAHVNVLGILTAGAAAIGFVATPTPPRVLGFGHGVSPSGVSGSQGNDESRVSAFRATFYWGTFVLEAFANRFGIVIT